MSKHNKKRNTGILYEQLLKYITKKVINDKKSNARKATKIIERRFKKGTELYKEFRLINALVNSTVSGTHIAAGILSEAKKAVKNIDNKKLNKEKSLLIKDINYQLNENNFYHQSVLNYKLYATVQTLLNEWKDIDNCDLKKVIEYENKIVIHLINEEKSKIVIPEDPRADNLVLKIMSEKINEKYTTKLTSEQKDIIRNYAINGDNPEALKIYFSNLKNKTASLVESYRKNTDNHVLLSKIDKVYDNIINLKVESIEDVDIKKYLTIVSLKDQILRSDHE
jgi:hypothetical protein